MGKLLAAFLIAFSLLLGEPQSIDIPIQNPSFQEMGPIYQTDSCGSRSWGAAVPGWRFGTGGSVQFQLAPGNPCNLPLPPNGGDIMALAAGTFSQDLGVSPLKIQASTLDPGHGYTISGVYTLKFWVASYFAINQPGVLSPIGAGGYPGEYDVELSFGTQQLCESYGWNTGHFTEITMVCPSPNYIVSARALPGGGPVQGSNNLILSFTGIGWPALFAGPVSLTFTPQ